MRKAFIIVLLCVFPVFNSCIGGQIKTAKKIVKKSEKLVAKAVSDIMKSGAKEACAKLSIEGGYSTNETLLIVLPENMKEVRKALAKLRLDSQLRKIEAGINRAAEEAAIEGLAVFLNVIKTLKIKDALDIIKGGKTAATKYLRKKGGARLREAYLPIVTRSLEKIKVLKDFNKLLKTYNSIPFAKKYELSIEEYVTDQALNGLFVEIAEAEKRIRKNPKTGGKTVNDVMKMFK